MTVDEMQALAHLVDRHDAVVIVTSTESHAPQTYATNGGAQDSVTCRTRRPAWWPPRTHTVTAAQAGKG